MTSSHLHIDFKNIKQIPSSSNKDTIVEKNIPIVCLHKTQKIAGNGFIKLGKARDHCKWSTAASVIFYPEKDSSSQSRFLYHMEGDGNVNVDMEITDTYSQTPLKRNDYILEFEPVGMISGSEIIQKAWNILLTQP